MEDLKTRLLDLEHKAKIKEDYCVVGQLISELDEETQEVLARVMRSTASTRSIWLELRAAGFSIDRGLVAMHRQGKCFCPEGDGQ